MRWGVGSGNCCCSCIVLERLRLAQSKRTVDFPRATRTRHDMMHDAGGAHAQASQRRCLVAGGILVMLFLTAPSCRHIEVAVRSGQLAWTHIKCLPGVGLGMGTCLKMPSSGPSGEVGEGSSHVNTSPGPGPGPGVCVCVCVQDRDQNSETRYCCDRRPEYCARDLSRCRWMQGARELFQDSDARGTAEVATASCSARCCNGT